MRTILAAFLASLAIVSSLVLYAGLYDAPPRWRTFVDRHGAVIGTVDPTHRGMRIWTPIEEIPDALLRQTIREEDRFFPWHRGINPFAILKAAAQNAAAFRVVRGGSTITQQLAKNLIQEREGRLSPRTLLSKLREAAVAVGLEARHSKQWILERYLNSIYYGRRAWGVGAAAELYYGKKPAALTAGEIETLVRLPRAPNRNSPLPFVRGGSGWGRSPFPRPSLQRRGTWVGRHFIEYVSAALPLGDARGRIATTLDLDLERRAEEAIDAVLGHRLEGDPLLTAAAVVIDVRSGDILAMVGSRDYFDPAIDGQVNAAVARRQPGSALKPFTYFAAFVRGFAADSLVPDEPLSFAAAGMEDAEGYAPQNFDRRYHGEVSIREALANSYNVPAVVTLNEIGLSFAHEILKGFGFTTLSRPPPHYGLAVTLGSGEVTLLELTGAYAALARGGAFLPFRFEPASKAPAPQPVIAGAAAAAAEVTAILSDPGARLKAFGFNESMEIEGHAVAIKTGTSYEHRDNWAVGYTPSVAVGVWVGHADGSPMDPKSSTGAMGAAPVWHALMENILRGREPEAFPVPALGLGAAPAPAFERASVGLPEAAPVGFRVTSPVPHTTYRLHPFLPLDHQRIMAEGEARQGEEVSLSWYLDGRSIEATHGKRGRIWIAPVPGRHLLRAESAAGEGVEIPFRVMAEDEGGGSS